ncbi:PepSY domain-containing protein [Gemmobacter lutimaris]|uniref:PepSY domain-containing protein n=1 Tax=Gemmobacter lutimaris TaxID=2306023 RepID=A0A398BZY0_9RHOB|nr:PepSY domain-containing protein [Gemmobacter lutimaris]RID93540.1 PepSY domain-containing protein [Gemmobacter lutimaris]
MKSLSLLAAAFLAVAAPAFASGDKIDDATRDKATAAMTAQGYEVRKVDMEDGMIEVYAVKDGKTFELYLDADMNIVKSNNE